jgi:DNA-binding LacI/PurR family transcriptional regulator
MIPSLTTIRSPVDAMVKAAFKLVLDDKKALGGNATVIRLKPELVIRESSSAKNRKHLKSNIIKKEH